MSIRPVFFFVVNVSAPMGMGKRFRLFIPLPVFCFNDFVESVADMAAFLNLITFGRLRVKVSEAKGKQPKTVAVKTFAKAAYTFSDVLTELSLFTGRFDLVKVNASDGDGAVSVKLFTF